MFVRIDSQTGSKGWIQKIQEGVARPFNSSIISRYFYFSEMEFYKNSTKFQRKISGGHGSLGPPLNLPLLTGWVVHLVV